MRLTSRGISVNPVTLATNLDGVFAGGDGVTGADLAVRAVAAGKLAAVSIAQYLEGRPVVGHPEMVSVVMGKLEEREMAEFFRGIEQTTRDRALARAHRAARDHLRRGRARARARRRA